MFYLAQGNHPQSSAAFAVAALSAIAPVASVFPSAAAIGSALPAHVRAACDVAARHSSVADGSGSWTRT